MIRPSSLSHKQFISLYRGNYKIYDKIRGIKSLLFKEISFFTKKLRVVQRDLFFHENVKFCSTRSRFKRKSDVLFNEISLSLKRDVLFNEISF